MRRAAFQCFNWESSLNKKISLLGTMLIGRIGRGRGARYEGEE